MTAARKLVTTVVVHDEAGDAHVFGPDSSEIPGWARDQIENPKAWGEEAPAEPRTAAQAVATDNGSDDTTGGDNPPAVPAKKAASAPAKKTAAKKATAKKSASASS